MTHRVLVIRDRLRASPLKGLTRPGHRIHTIRSLLRSTPWLTSATEPDLVVIEVPRPDSFRLDFLRFVKSRWPQRPLLVLTDALASVAVLLTAGADRVLTSPRKLATLTRAIEELTRGGGA